jgi:hypothetical protein
MKKLEGNVGSITPIIAIILLVLLVFGARPEGYPGGRNSDWPNAQGGCAWILCF